MTVCRACRSDAAPSPERAEAPAGPRRRQTTSSNPAIEGRALRPSQAPLSGRRCACGGSTGPTGECAACRERRLRREIAPPAVHDVLAGPARRLEPPVRAEMERRLGIDLSRVRIHTDGPAAESARAVDAEAYTVGPDVVFGPGRYAPETAAGHRLLSHELVHVTQQRGAATGDRGELAVGRTDEPAEREAQALTRGARPGPPATPNGPAVLRRQPRVPGHEPPRTERVTRVLICCADARLGLETTTRIYFYNLTACEVPIGHYSGLVAIDGRQVRLPFITSPLLTAPLGRGQRPPADLVRAHQHVEVDVVESLDLQTTGGKRLEFPPPASDVEPASDEPAPKGALDDPLYLASSRWEPGRTPHSALTGRNLIEWAKRRGRLEARADLTVMRMQEKDGSESTIVGDILVLLQDLLWGIHDPKQYAIGDAQTAAILVGDSRYFATPVDTAEARRLGEFEGSDAARGNAVLELTYNWERVAADLEVAVREKFQESLLDAAARAPAYLVYATTDYSGRVLVPEHDARAELETHPEEIGRIRSGNPYKDEAWILVGQQPVVRVGARWGTKHIVNLSEFFVWFDVEGQPTVAGQPLWYYRAPLSMFTSNLWLGAVAKDIAEAARFAALLFPALIHYAGLILSFSPTPVTMIAGVFLSELGEEGMRAVRGEPGRSARELGLDFGKDVLINLTVAKIFGGSEAGGDLQAGAEAARIADKAANEARQAVLDELVHTEGGLLERALNTGEVRPVTDQALLDEGFTVEVEIEHAGGRHVYRQAPSGRWCRWSVLRVCELNVPTSSIGGTRAYYELEARIQALEGTDAPADLIEQFDRINRRSPDAEQLRRLTERVEFAEREALPSDPESVWETTARSEAERRPGRRPSASRPRTSAQSDFMKDARGIIGANSRHPLRFLLDETKRWWSRTHLSELPTVQAGHLVSYHSGAPEALALEDSWFNQASNWKGERYGAVFEKSAVEIGGVPVELRTAMMWESIGELPAGTVASAMRSAGWAPL